ncbi:MAG: putative manganese-dependent inorganic diphosphatase [Spirochaetaceae bacterium]|jgi:manganese-dependent inorganic pyrophosphatase|nr:putative manganese-dependent inorganic diphosphatase [Spirochaetaceae bacterium]
MNKRIYIIGHRNPDTDSVVSAAAYARLKRAQGLDHCFAARAGKLSPQTEYILDRFKVPVPEYLPDLIPKAAYYLSEPPVTVDADVSLWDALERMQQEGLRVLPIVDRDGVYQSMLHYKLFARYVIANINPHKKSAFPVSLGHLVTTLRARPVTLYNAKEVKESPLVVAASYNEYFKTHLEHENPDDALVILGDRWDIQEFCLKRRVRSLILSNGHTLGPGLAALAKENRVSVISSPYDTSSTAALAIYSVPVGAVGDTTVPLMHLTDTIKKIRPPLSRAPSRCIPIGDDAGRVKGVIFEGDLIEEPNIEVILVDHNEPSQAIEGIEHYKILEVIDHHRLGNLATKYPITFINKVVGATCTIITNLYREQGLTPDKDIASALLCGILADTLSLQSATTTDTDREAAAYLSALSGLEIQILSNELQSAANQVNTCPAVDLVTMDMKEYSEQGLAFSVSQIETDTPDILIVRMDELFTVLDNIKNKRDLLFSALLVTDVTTLDSLLFIRGERSFLSQMPFPIINEGIYLLKDVVSRKKQLIPLFSELMESMAK